MVANCLVDMTGKTFGWLTVLDRTGSALRNNKKRYALWRCRCICGQEVLVRGQQLRRGKRKACGVAGHVWRVRGGLRADHPAEYRTFEQIHKRCRAKQGKHAKGYHERGIKVCERWREFKNFFADMGPRPKGLTIERIDNNGHYEPGNCRWATFAEQRRNQRRSVFVEYEGERLLLMDLCVKLGLSRGIVHGRLLLGWALEDALLVPVKKYKQK